MSLFKSNSCPHCGASLNNYMDAADCPRCRKPLTDTEAGLVKEHETARAEREKENRRRPKRTSGPTCKLCGSKYNILTAEFGAGLCKACSEELAAIRKAKKNRPPEEAKGQTDPPVPDLAPAQPNRNTLFYYRIKDEEKGPYTLGQLRSMWDSGQITADAVSRGSESSEWLPVAQRIGRAEATVEPHQQAPAASSKEPSPTKVSPAIRSGGIPKIGKRGWLGVIMLCYAAWTFINAEEGANEHGKRWWENMGSEHYMEASSLAKEAGYGDMHSYLVHEEHQTAGTIAGFGAALIGWGFWKKRAKSNVSPTTGSTSA